MVETDDVTESMSEGWEIDDTLLVGFAYTDIKSSNPDDIHVHSKLANKTVSNSFIKISLSDIENNQSLSRTLPYKKVVL